MKIQEKIRRNFSKLLMDTNEENQLKVDIILDSKTFGLSTLQILRVESIWQHPTEGIIYFKIQDYDDYLEFDDINIQDLVNIYTYIKNYGRI